MRDKTIQSGATKWGSLMMFLAMFALLAGLYLPGCSDGPTTSPDVTLSQDETSYFDEPFDEVEFARLVDLAAVDDEYLYGEELLSVVDGGSIVIGTAGNFHEFYVPPGALSQPTLIQMEILKVEKKDNIVAVYDFGPDGLVFLQSAWLIVDPAKLLGKKATCVDFYYLDEGVNPAVWVLQGTYCVDPFTQKCAIPVDHFSKYGID